MNALDIIERWIAIAEARRMGHACAEFWTVRDILEGVLRVPDERKAQAVEFLKTCKASPERDELLKAVEHDKLRATDIQATLFD